MQKVAIFIDGANLYAAHKALGFDIDYSKFLTALAPPDKVALVRAYYYTALYEDDTGFAVLTPLIDWLSYNGYSVVTKPAKSFTGTDGVRKIKGNMDVELAVGAMLLAPKVDKIVLVSGDGDFSVLVDAIQRVGTRVTVVSTTKSHPSPMVADELRRAADQFVDLEEIRTVIARPRATAIRATAAAG